MNNLYIKLKDLSTKAKKGDKELKFGVAQVVDILLQKPFPMDPTIQL